MTLGIYHVIIIKAIHAKNSFYMFLKQQIEFLFYSSHACKTVKIFSIDLQ